MLDTKVIYIVNKDLNIPEGKVKKPFYAQFKEMVRKDSDVFARFIHLDNYFQRTDDTFLIRKTRLNNFIDNCLTDN